MQRLWAKFQSLPKVGKILIGIVIFFLTFPFWPFIIGSFIAYQANKRITGKNLKYSIIGIVLFFTFFIGSAWTYGTFNQKPQVANIKSPNQPTVGVQQTAVKEEVPTVNQIIPSPEASFTPTPTLKLYEVKVTKVVDGDTIQVTGNKVIRIIGIDTPETVDPRKLVQCFGVAASNKAKELLTGKTVKLEADSSQGELDKYNRTLRYIWIDEQTDYGAWMIQNGYAFEYIYDLPYKYQEKYKTLQKEAEQNKAGLWADDACPTPTVATVKPTAAKTYNPPVQNNPPAAQNNSGGFTCAGKTKCGDMVSCAEAMYYLNTCGLSRLDGDKDGTPCETLCR